MDKKIIFFDIDGTILDDKKQIPESTMEAIRQLRKNGIYTAIATGRGPDEMEWICEALEIDTYVAINGAYAVYEGQEIYLDSIGQDDIIGLTRTVEQNNHSIAYIAHDDIWTLHDDHPLIHSCIETLQMEYPRIDKKLHIKKPISQAVVYSEAKDDAMYREQHPNLSFIRFHEFGMDAIPKGCSKAIGIQKIIEAVGFEKENVYAFGDAKNDLEMISYVGYGVAMGNSIPELKAMADYVTTSNNENGIWNACKQLGFIKSKVV